MNYADVAAALGCRGIRMGDPDRLADAIESVPGTGLVRTIVDVVVTRASGRMLPAADSRTVEVRKGNRAA